MTSPVFAPRDRVRATTADSIAMRMATRHPPYNHLTVKSINHCFTFPLYGGNSSSIALKRSFWSSTPRALENASKPWKPCDFPTPLWPTPPKGSSS